MELLLATIFANPPPSPSTPDGRQGPFAADSRPTDSSAPNENGLFDALLGVCALESPIPPKTVSLQDGPLPVLGVGGPAPCSPERAAGGGAREIAWLPGIERATGESRPGLVEAEAVRNFREQTPQKVEVASPQVEGSSPARHPTVAESDDSRADKVRDETVEGAFLSKERGPGRGEAQEAGPRAMFSRMEVLKGMEQAAEQQGVALKEVGPAGQGENGASLAGKDGTLWKQDVQTDLPTRPAPPAVMSTQAAPAHTLQAGSGETFRILRDAVHMRIQDEELGPMRWHIHLSGGRITAEAVVETARVQELLQNHQDVLESKLNAMGVEVEEFDVSVDGGSQRFAAFSNTDRSGRSRRSAEELPREVSLEPVVSKLQPHMDPRLDMYV